MVTLSGIKVCVWDFDGTFYPLTKEITDDIEERQYDAIGELMGWDRERAKRAFWSVYPSRTTSGNEAVSIICGIPTSQAAMKSEARFNRIQYVKSDPELVALFLKLRGFRHFILANGAKALLQSTLPVLGLPLTTFEEIVTSETVGVNKPHPDGFLYILKKTGLPPGAHCMIGDREAVDLIPAKKLGLHTCLVAWGNMYPELPKTGRSVDFIVPTVYDIRHILL
jgi:putative hydrolase of the HAD superfamily